VSAATALTQEVISKLAYFDDSFEITSQEIPTTTSCKKTEFCVFSVFCGLEFVLWIKKAHHAQWHGGQLKTGVISLPCQALRSKSDP
jgi:hypothetical protein